MQQPHAHARFFKRHFSSFFPPFLLYVATLLFVPLALVNDARELPVRLKGHFTRMEIKRDNSPTGHYLQFQTKEHPQIFLAHDLREVDRALFILKEKQGASVVFSVERGKFESENGARVPVLSLSTDSNVYLRSTDFTGIMQADRTTAIVIGLALLLAGLWLSSRLYGRFQVERELPGEDLYDPSLISVARWLYWLVPPLASRLKWVGAARAFGDARELVARTRTTATQTPKHLKAINILLQSGRSIDMKNGVGSTPLHLSVEAGSTEAVELLLKNGADMNSTDALGRTPLMIAAATGKLAIVLKLLDKGADVLFKSTSGETALSCAGENKKNKAVLQTIETADRRAKLKLGLQEKASIEGAAPSAADPVPPKKN